MENQAIQEAILRAVLTTTQDSPQRRQEALREFFGVTLPGLSETEVNMLATRIPALVPGLQTTWATAYAETLLNTLPRNQLVYLCDGSEENNAALRLAYVIFLESERMEKQMKHDLAEMAQQIQDECGDDAMQHDALQLDVLAEALRNRLIPKR